MSGNILIAEDEAALSKVLKMMLEMQGFSVRTAGDGAEAMAMIKQQKPDLLLCDLMMPGMDGYQVCEAVKKDAKLKSIPVLILTALKAGKEKDRLLALGADGFATKPFDSKALTAEIRRLLGA
jgi:two-component system alkaline phosphatase synthesis response regulator PhoP